MQANKTTRSVMTQTGQKNRTKPSVPKHVAEYGPHQKLTRRYEEGHYQEELGLIKGKKLSALWTSCSSSWEETASIQAVFLRQWLIILCVAPVP